MATAILTIFSCSMAAACARVQVKSCFAPPRGDGAAYPVTVTKYTRPSGRTRYSLEEIDFIAAFVASQRAWYLIPVESLKNRQVIRLYPRGKPERIGAFYETYREAWHLLKEPELAGTGENKQQVAPSSGAVPNP